MCIHVLFMTHSRGLALTICLYCVTAPYHHDKLYICCVVGIVLCYLNRKQMIYDGGCFAVKGCFPAPTIALHAYMKPFLIKSKYIYLLSIGVVVRRKRYTQIVFIGVRTSQSKRFIVVVVRRSQDLRLSTITLCIRQNCVSISFNDRQRSVYNQCELQMRSLHKTLQVEVIWNVYR